MNTRAQGPSDFRFTAFDFDTAKYDSMMDLLETTRRLLEVNYEISRYCGTYA